MSRKLFAIQCRGTDLYRITEDRHHKGKDAVTLERLGPNGWYTVEHEYTDEVGMWETATLLFSRIVRMYGSPRPTKVIPYRDVGPIQREEEFEARYDFDRILDTVEEFEIDYSEVDIIEDE